MSLDQLVLKRVLLLGLPALLLLLVLEELAGYCYSYGLCETDGTNVFQYGKSATFITRVSHIRLISFAIKQTNKYYLGAQKASGRIIFFSTHFELLIIRVSRLREEMLICILYMMLPNALVQINLSYSALRMDRCMVY
uniref:Uncharacterized protein n=1 Tax=Picea glauca TaxID=3330 RepID=A0A101M0T3_PICGL|nr:hypothetical protein ABT39_MTgene4144 [Picea glauca]